MTNMLQSLGSPDALLAVITESGGASLAPVIALAGEAVGPTEWVVHERFVDGFAPFPEYCEWAAGLYSNIPQLFGMRPEVEHIACACNGAPACEYRIRWFPDEPGANVEFLESRVEVLTARLESLHQTVGDLVSEDDLERVLTKIVVGRARDARTDLRARARSAAVGPEARLRDRASTTRKRMSSPSRCSRATQRTTSTASSSTCARRSAATDGSPRSTRTASSSRRNGSCSRRTHGSRPPPSTPRPRSTTPAARPAPRAPCSTCRTRSPNSSPPTTWPRSSPAPSRPSSVATAPPSPSSSRTPPTDG